MMLETRREAMLRVDEVLDQLIDEEWIEDEEHDKDI